MSSSRIEIFKQILETDPGNSNVLFGLAKEYEKAGLNEELIETLNRYLASSDDEGNAFGMLASAYEKIGEPNQSPGSLSARRRSSCRTRSSINGRRVST